MNTAEIPKPCMVHGKRISREGDGADDVGGGGYLLCFFSYSSRRAHLYCPHSHFSDCLLSSPPLPRRRRKKKKKKTKKQKTKQKNKQKGPSRETERQKRLQIEL